MSAVVAAAASAAIATTGTAASLASIYWLDSRLIAGLLLAITVIAAWQCWDVLTASGAHPPAVTPDRFHRPHSRLRQRHQPAARRFPRAPLARR